MLSRTGPAVVSVHTRSKELPAQWKFVRPWASSDSTQPIAVRESTWGSVIRRERPGGTHDLVGFSATGKGGSR